MSNVSSENVEALDYDPGGHESVDSGAWEASNPDSWGRINPLTGLGMGLAGAALVVPMVGGLESLGLSGSATLSLMSFVGFVLGV